MILLVRLAPEEEPENRKSPMPGILLIELVKVVVIRPAMANVCPSRNSTSVSVRRVERAGTRNPSITTALAKSSELTSA